ncbi:MAG: WD40 repeat domain-containing protein, partial [Desulfobacterales bacterium]|nr:WD40 repeat domain-containing protein [Desulfobacterales bacterium]
GNLIRHWNIPRENELLPIQMVCLSPDGTLMVATGLSAAGVWSVDTGERVFQFNPPGSAPHRDTTIAGFSDDGQRLATTDRSNRLRLWDTSAWGGKPTVGPRISAYTLPFTPDGQRVFFTVAQMISTSLGEVSVEVYDSQTQTLLLRLDRRSGWGTSIGYHPRQRRLLHTVIDSGSPAYGTELMTALPWLARDYPEATAAALPQRVQRFARSGHWARLQEPRIADYPDSLPLPESRSNWRPRDPATPAPCVDLTAAYNGHLESGWGPEEFLEEYGNDLAELPQGTVRLDGVDWDIRGIVATGQPQSHPLRPTRLTRTVSSVPVPGHARRLHFLHAAGGPLEDGQRLGRYRLHYADGNFADLTLEAGEDIGDWWTGRPGSSCRRGSVAWAGGNPAATRVGAGVRLFHRAWDNPYPEKEIVSLDLIGEHERATCFLVAITREP